MGLEDSYVSPAEFIPMTWVLLFMAYRRGRFYVDGERSIHREYQKVGARLSCSCKPLVSPHAERFQILAVIVAIIHAITIYREYIIFYSGDGTNTHGRETITALSWYSLTLCKGLILEIHAGYIWGEKVANISGIAVIVLLAAQFILASFKYTVDVMSFTVIALDVITYLSSIGHVFRVFKTEKRRRRLMTVVMVVFYVSLAVSFSPIYIMESKKYGSTVDHWAPFVAFFGSICFFCMNYIVVTYKEHAASIGLYSQDARDISAFFDHPTPVRNEPTTQSVLEKISENQREGIYVIEEELGEVRNVQKDP